MMDKKKLFFIVLCLFLGGASSLLAQKLETTDRDLGDGRAGAPNTQGVGFEPRRLQLGGDIGLSFGNNSGYINLSPLVGYQVTNRFSAGLGPAYERYWQRDIYNNKYGITVLGGRVYSRYQLFSFLFVHGEFALLNFKATVNNQSDHVWTKRLPLGLGYTQRVAGNSYGYLMVLYDVLYDPNSPYQVNNVYNGFIVRGGFTLGL